MKEIGKLLQFRQTVLEEEIILFFVRLNQEVTRRRKPKLAEQTENLVLVSTGPEQPFVFEIRVVGSC